MEQLHTMPEKLGVHQRPLGKSVKQLSQRGLSAYRTVRSNSMTSFKNVQTQFVADARNKLRREIEEAKAEASEFIMSPHLLFRPLSLGFFALFPLLLPLAFVPLKLVAAYLTFFLGWYLIFVAFVACEVAMRPPWYRYPGLPKSGNPPYWGSYVHDPKRDLGLEFEDVFVCKGHPACTDGVKCKHFKLSGWFIPHAQNQDRVVVCVHGAGRDRRAFLRHVPVFYELGYSVLLFDLSEHGLSDGNNRGFSFGAREAGDVVSVVQYLGLSRNVKEIVLAGTSTGATSAILAAAQFQVGLDLGVQITGIVAENPFARPADLFRHHLEDFLRNYLSQNRHHMWRRLVFWFFSRVLLFRIGMLMNYGAEDAVPTINCPLLVMHSKADTVVPFSHGERVYNAALGKRLFMSVEEADHCALYDRYPDEWIAAVRRLVMYADESEDIFDNDTTGQGM